MSRRIPPRRGRTIRTSIRTSASPARLWDAWADPARLAEWFPDRAEGQAFEGAIQTWFFDRFGYVLPYEVVTAVPGEHLVLTGDVPGRPRFHLEIEITTAGGVSTLTLTNSGFLDADGWDEEYEGIVSGWTLALAVLKQYVERYYGSPRSQFFAMRPAVFEYGDLLAHYRDPVRLQAWLTGEGHIGEPGEAYSLVLGDGQRVGGTVLAVTAWEVLLAWDEIDGVVGLKAFGIGGGRRAVCVHGSGWGLSPGRAAALEVMFGEALARLTIVLSQPQPSPTVTGRVTDGALPADRSARMRP